MTRRLVETPIGRIVLASTARGLSSVDLVAATRRLPTLDDHGPGRDHVLAAERALRAYFAGSTDAFTDLVLAPEATAFQQSVWRGLRAIPYGTAISYRELAARIGRPAAVRAVGLANGRNPLPIVVPCHRVIGADGSLTGFGLGVDVKAWLLVHEGAAAAFAAPVTAASRVNRVSPSAPAAPAQSHLFR
jgi:methylated-DNA-[protein]-cysteine S-methyltransferase